MEISGDLVNNELLSTFVFIFLYCSIIHITVKTIINALVDFIDYLYEEYKKKTN